MTSYKWRIGDWSSDGCSSDRSVDSHGQSAVGIAFCRLLGFELAPRLKAVARQKLALPQAGMRTRLSNLLPILSSPIDWDEIEQQYDERARKRVVTGKRGSVRVEFGGRCIYKKKKKYKNNK